MAQAKKTYSKLITRYRRFLFPLINRYDWGYLCPNRKHPVQRLTNEHYATLCSTPGSYWNEFIYKSDLLEQAVLGTHVNYFRASQRNRKMLLMIDVDAKVGAATREEARATTDFITKSILKGAYHEPSTNGNGQHIYFVFDRRNMSLSASRTLISKLEASIKSILDRKKMRVNIDRLCGTPTLLNYRKAEMSKHYFTIHPGNRGVLAKVPTLPDWEESLEQLMKAPVVLPSKVRKIITRGEQAAKSLRLRASPEESAPHPTYTTYDILSTAYSEQDESVEKQLLEMKSNPDAFRRMHFACNLFRTKKKRLPKDEDELVAFYIANGLQTDNDRNKRRFDRAHSVIEFQKEVDPNPLMTNGCNLPKYINLVKKHVTLEHRKASKDKRQITDEDLAIVLYLIERNALCRATQDRWQGTTGNKAIIGLFSVMRSAGKTGRGCSLNKAVAAKKILAASGLITEEDKTWVYAGPKRGICKKFGLGANHPRAREFLAVKAQRMENDAAIARGNEYIIHPVKPMLNIIIEDDLDDIFMDGLGTPSEAYLRSS